jgi:hypothetical protein
MSTYDDDEEDIAFEFFDEPETVEATQRGRRLPRRGGDGPRRPPLRTPTGLVPLARLVGLIAIAIVVVLGLVFWVGSCQGKSKHDEYASYMSKVKTLAQTSNALGQDFASELATPGLKQTDLATKLQQYASQEQQAYDQAQQLRPPGPLRAIHQRLIDAIELRAKGLAGLGVTLTRKLTSTNATATTDTLAAQAQLLTASDVVWDQLYKGPATQQMKQFGVSGVAVPESHFVGNPELISSRSFGVLLQRLNPATTGGKVTGKHGDSLLSVRALPQGVTLSTSTATTVKAPADLSFVATVQDSGDFPETAIPVTLTIDTGTGTPIVKRQTIQIIQQGQQVTVNFTGFQLPTAAFGNKATVKVEVAPVAGEINTANNSATYTVFFTLS